MLLRTIAALACALVLPTLAQAQVKWDLPTGFGLTSMTFNQIHGTDGAILAGVTLGVPEPSTWAMMLLGFGGLGALLRRRRAAPLAI